MDASQESKHPLCQGQAARPTNHLQEVAHHTDEAHYYYSRVPQETEVLQAVACHTDFPRETQEMKGRHWVGVRSGTKGHLGTTGRPLASRTHPVQDHRQRSGRTAATHIPRQGMLVGTGAGARRTRARSRVAHEAGRPEGEDIRRLAPRGRKARPPRHMMKAGHQGTRTAAATGRTDASRGARAGVGCCSSSLPLRTRALARSRRQAAPEAVRIPRRMAHGPTVRPFALLGSH